MACWNGRKNSLPIGKSTFGGRVDASDYIYGILTVTTDEIELLGLPAGSYGFGNRLLDVNS